MSDVTSEPKTLAILLGVESEAEEDPSELKKAAYRRYRDSLKGDDIDEQMAALDDYIELRDLGDG